MTKFLLNAFAKMLNLYTKEQVEVIRKCEKLNGKIEESDRYFKRKEEIEISCIEQDVGKPFICISNEWENPVIGIVLGVEFVSAARQPVVKIYDFISDSVKIIFGKRLPFNDYNLNAILKLDPYERWNLMTCSNLKENKTKINTDIFNAEEIKLILHNRKFYIVINELAEAKKALTNFNADSIRILFLKHGLFFDNR